MLPRDRGVIVQVGSALAYRGIPLQSAYCASKHAIPGFNDRAEDITPHVKETWARCAAIVRRLEIKALLRAADGGRRRFVEAFALLRKAYDEGALAYGMFTARKF